jgi:hypothetical protein
MGSALVMRYVGYLPRWIPFLLAPIAAAAMLVIVPAATASAAANVRIFDAENYCLGVNGASTEVNAPVITITCNSGGPAQHWTYGVSDPTNSKYENIVNLNSGLCLGILGGGSNNGAGAIQTPCVDTDVAGGASPDNSTHPDQYWTFIGGGYQSGDSTFYAFQNENGKCLL